MVRLADHKFLLYWNTLKWLRPVQWHYRVKNYIKSQYHRRFPEIVRRALLLRVPSRIFCQAVLKPVAWFNKRHDGDHGMFCAEDILKGRFTFLNCSKQFGDVVQWENPEFTYLWDFNLHYFEYLEALVSSGDDSAEETIRALLYGWLDNNPCPIQPAWHPYPISLRTINWIKLFVNHSQFADEIILQGLYSQLLFLEQNIEKHLLGNHVLENGRAMLFGGLFFEGQDAHRWFDTGLHLLKQEIREEYLPNGGHFERSPMYHCILLEALLDTYTYLASKGYDTVWLAEPLHKMCSWLENIQCPDGSFPLFNDAAFGISAAPEEILGNAERIVGYERKQRFESIRDCDQFFVLDNDTFFCVVDGAPIGPSYNPSHAHSDNLTYELFFNDQRLVVDSGTYCYDADTSRQFFRSTCNHNTIVINSLEQSQVWRSFRVARRSNTHLSRAGQSETNLVFQGEFKNRVDPSQKIVHERIIVVKPSYWILIWDVVKAKNDIIAKNHCHFAPGWCTHKEGKYYRIDHASQGEVYCFPFQVSSIKQTTGQYAPEFGKCMSIEKLIFMGQARQHLEMGYLFTSEEHTAMGDFSVERLEEYLIIQACGARTDIDLEGLHL